MVDRVSSVVAFLLIVTSSSGTCCPPWTLPYNSAEDSTTQCRCGDDLGGVVDCNNDTLQVSVLVCYCMTYNTELNMTLVGHCLETCEYNFFHTQVHTTDPALVNNEFCGVFNRSGQLCGECAEGYGVPVYTYTLPCVPCDKSDFTYNLLKYIAVAFVPLTGFYLIVMIFKINATAGYMVAYILVCQLLAAPVQFRQIVKFPRSSLYMYVETLLSIWNLDAFRILYNPFCIHPAMTTLHVLALDYLIGVYPLVLICVTYIAVMLHDRYPLVVRLWRPVNKLCMCIRREWNIRGSLVQAFATFLVLSYVKILNASFDLLTPVFLQTPDGEYINQSYLYYAGEIPYFGREHLPFGVLAIVMLTVVNILPMILLFLYPCSCCRKCLNYCHLNRPILHTFMDTFQGCYHHKPRERRYFAAIYLLLRVLEATSAVFLHATLYVPAVGFYLVILVLTIGIFQPYKSSHQNVLDQIVLSLLVLSGYMFTASLYSFIMESHFKHFSLFYFCLEGSSFFCLFIYGIYILLKIVLPAKVFKKAKQLFNRRRSTTTLDELTHDRKKDVPEHSPLLQT